MVKLDASRCMSLLEDSRPRETLGCSIEGKLLIAYVVIE